MLHSRIRGALVALCLIAFFPHPATATEVGRVISLRPGVIAERGGQPVPLEQKSPVNQTDVLATDATGRAQILFADDSSVALGSNTRLALESVVAEGKNPVFKARMGQGMARFITGKIVEQNPDGFAVVTPEATVGIRGTIFAVSSREGKTTVYVMNTTRQVHVNGIMVPSGYKITLPDGSPLPMSPADMSLVGEATVAGNGPAQSGESLENSPTLAGGSTVFDPVTLDQPELGKQAIGDSLKPTGPAYIAGTLHNTNLSGAPQRGVGSFAFTVDLGSGLISAASMSNSHPGVGQNADGGGPLPLPVSYTLSGGSGRINGSSFQVSGLSGPTMWRGTLSSISPGIPGGGSADMSGSANMGASGLSVNGQYSVEFPGGGGNFDNGTFTGKQQ